MMGTAGGRGVEDRSIGQLVEQATEQMSRLVRDEMKLAAAELKEKGRRAGAGAGLFGAATVLGWFGLAALVTCLILALSLAVAPWLAALIVAVAVLLIAGLLALLGKRQVQQALPPVPEEAVSSVKRDVRAVKEGLQR